MSTCEKRLSCKSVRSSYYDLLNAETAGSVPKEVHEHVASCADCQSEMNRLRELLFSAGKERNDEQRHRDNAVIELLSLHLAWSGRPVWCADAKPFLPSMADPLLKIRVQTPITAHVENCKACSEELSALIESGLGHKQLCRISSILAGDCEADAESSELQAATPMVKGMMERPDSGIATLFTLGKSNGNNGKDEPHAFPPIKVQVIGANRSSKRSRNASFLNRKLLLKPVLATAAVILIGFAIFFQAPAVKAVAGPEQIYKAIKGADNIHISQFMPGNPEPVQEKWLSRSRGIYMTRTGQEFVLWDITNGQKNIQETFGAETETLKLTKNEIATIKKKINGTLGITPFNNISDIPPDAKWKESKGVDIEPEFEDCKVFDREWSEINNAGETVFIRWRYFIESSLCRPKQVESSSMALTDVKYIQYNHKVIEYVDEKDVETAIAKASFQQVLFRRP